jgi:hypothetical protein
MKRRWGGGKMLLLEPFAVKRYHVPQNYLELPVKGPP